MPKNKNLTGGIVYSTNPHFRMEENNFDANATDSNSTQDLRVWLEKNHRGGKTATVIKGFSGNQTELESLGKLLKQKCGTGGTVKDGEVIIQGDHREKILVLLQQLGHKAKKAGS